MLENTEMLMDIADNLAYLSLVLDEVDWVELGGLIVSIVGVGLTLYINWQTRKEVMESDKRLLDDKKYERTRKEILETYGSCCAAVNVLGSRNDYMLFTFPEAVLNRYLQIKDTTEGLHKRLNLTKLVLLEDNVEPDLIKKIRELCNKYNSICIKLDEIYSSKDYFDRIEGAWKLMKDRYGYTGPRNPMVFNDKEMKNDFIENIKMQEMKEYFDILEDIYGITGSDEFDELFHQYVCRG